MMMIDIRLLEHEDSCEKKRLTPRIDSKYLVVRLHASTPTANLELFLVPSRLYKEKSTSKNNNQSNTEPIKFRIHPIWTQ